MAAKVNEIIQTIERSTLILTIGTYLMRKSSLFGGSPFNRDVFSTKISIYLSTSSYQFTKRSPGKSVAHISIVKGVRRRIPRKFLSSEIVRYFYCKVRRCDGDAMRFARWNIVTFYWVE